MDRLFDYCREQLELEEPLIVAGDYNVIPTPADARFPEAWVNDALFLPETRSRYRALINLGFTDAVRAVSEDPGIYTFWDYQAGAWQKNNGIRIDHLLLSPAGVEQVIRGWRRQARPGLGEAVGPCSGLDRSGI